jgi:MFS family permease
LDPSSATWASAIRPAGLLQGLSFALFYTVMGLPLGRLADKRSRRNLIAAGVVVWSFFTSACSVAKGLWSLFFTRIGVGEASLSPAAYSPISDYFPPERLSVAIGVYYVASFWARGIRSHLPG